VLVSGLVYFDGGVTTGLGQDARVKCRYFGTYVPQFPYNTASDTLKKASVTEFSPIRLSVSRQYRLVTDRQTDGQHRGRASTALA